jgi:hypothetical protein
MTKHEIRQRMKAIEEKATTLSVALNALVDDLEMELASRTTWRRLRSADLIENLERLKEWDEAVCEISADRLILE